MIFTKSVLYYVKMSLTTEQQQVMDYVGQGYSMFVSGPGGVGKSYLIKHIYSTFENVVLTALTGCAATLIGDTALTLHSWAGIGLGGDVQEMLKDIRIRKKVANWENCGILVIDEVSMLTGELFDNLNKVAQILRKNRKPFGGIQLLLFGDLFQLPPVNKSEGFVFESEAWSSCIDYVFTLKKIIRQTDKNWQKVLNKIRVGVFDDLCEELLAPRVVEDTGFFKDWEIKPTILYCRKVDVDAINVQELQRLKSPVTRYKVQTVTGIENPLKKGKDGLDQLDKIFPYNVELYLVVGAQVMLVTNLDIASGLINGSRGVVTGYGIGADGDSIPVVKFKNGETRLIDYHSWTHKSYKGVTKKQIPLKLGWACTIHKIQGQTLDSVIVDCGRTVFEYGQIYVALSRVKDLESLYLLEFDIDKILVHPKVKEFYENL